MIRDGLVTSQSDRFCIEVHGAGGHGARPHEATDAVVVSGLLITAIQSLVSREINPLHPSVVTIGKIAAGSAANVIASEARLEGSIRTTLAETRTRIHHGLKRMASAVAELYDAAIDIEIVDGYPPVLNTPEVVAVARSAATTIVGADALLEDEHPSLGSEDFSYYLDKVPGCFVRFGARRPDWEPIALHNPSFDVDEDVLRIGASFFAEVVREAGRRHVD